MSKQSSTLRRIFRGLADLAHERGIAFALRAAAWRLQTALEKARIVLEDRLRLYSYRDWFRDFEKQPALPVADTPHDPGAPPRFSLLVHYEQTSQGDLHQTIRSLIDQTFPNWEARLVLHRTGMPAPPGWSSASDPRFLPSLERHPTDYRAAIGAARGDFILALCGGDALSPHTLAEFARRLEADPNLDILYSDEDCLAEDGQTRHSPFFKPDWSPELLYSINYIDRGAFRRGLLLEVLSDEQPGVVPGYQDLIYRALDPSRRALHIPQVLVHRSPGIDYLGDGDDLWRFGRLYSLLQRQGLESITVSTDRRGEILLTWSTNPRLVSIIIPTRDQADYLKRCLASIRKYAGKTPYEIVLVETGSRETATLALYEALQAETDIHLIPYAGVFNFSAALNLGARHARGDLLLFLNNDTEAVQPGWLNELARWACLPGVGIVGARLLYPNGTIQHAGIIIGMEGHASHVFAGLPEDHDGPFGSPGWYRDVSAVTGACMMMRREVFDILGGFDEAYQLVFSDIEICLRAWQQGYRVMYTPHARLIHHEGRTRYRYMPVGDIRLGYQHFGEVVERGDPFYNPNLSLAVRTPTLRRPWETSPAQRLGDIVKYFWPEP